MRKIALVLLLTACQTPTPPTDDPSVVDNSPPTFIVQTVSATIDEDTVATFTGMAADPDSDTLSLTGTKPSHGVVTTSFANGTATVTYTPEANFNGTDSFSLGVSDASGGSSASIAFSVIVKPVDDAPSAFHAPQSVSCHSGSRLTLTVTTEDIDGGTLSVSSQNCPGNFAIGTDGVIDVECPAIGTDCAIDVSSGGASTSITLAANTIFVAPSGTGDGASWSNAIGSVTSAIANRGARDVWVKAGTYAPFAVSGVTGLSMFGGFTGTEATLSERASVASTVIDANGAGTTLAVDTCENLLLDGFVFQRGYSATASGGVRILNTPGFTLKNVFISGNGSGTVGAGLSVVGSSGAIERSAVVGNSGFPQLPIGSQGAGAYVESSTLHISNSLFAANRVDAGEPIALGATGNDASGGAVAASGSALTLVNVSFHNNRAVASFAAEVASEEAAAGGQAAGGAIFLTGGSLSCHHCTFDNNEAVGGLGGLPSLAISPTGGSGGNAQGGAIFANTPSLFVVSDSVFIGNTVTGGRGGQGFDSSDAVDGGNGGAGGNAVGGAIFASGGTGYMLSSVSYSNNTAAGGPGGRGGNTSGGAFGFGGAAGVPEAGAVAIEAAGIVIDNCAFYQNQAVVADAALGGGGGVGGNTGTTGQPGTGALEIGGGSVTDSAFFDNSGSPTDISGGSITQSCTQQDTGNTTIMTSPFGTPPLSGQLTASSALCPASPQHTGTVIVSGTSLPTGLTFDTIGTQSECLLIRYQSNQPIEVQTLAAGVQTASYAGDRAFGLVCDGAAWNQSVF